MNTNTGATYFVSQAFGEELAREEGRQLAVLEKLATTADEMRAVEAVRAGDPVVPVSREVVQQVQLGQRELDRRRRRRKQSRDARRRNRT